MRAFISTVVFASLAGIVSIAAQSQNDIYGTLTVVKGDVQVIDGKAHAAHAARAGARVFPGDTVQTGHDSRAKITMVDSNVLNISPDTKMLIEKYEYNPAQNKKNVILSVDYGKLRSAVNQKYDGEVNTYHVKTPSAVAGVRGTDFLVSYDKVSQSSQVVTFRGQVEVGSGLDLRGHIQASVRVDPGHATYSTPGNAPSKPVDVPPQQLNNLNHDTSTDTSTTNSSSANSNSAVKNGRAPAATTPNLLAPTVGDLTNTATATDVGRAPAALSPLVLQDSVVPATVTQPLVNSDIVKGGAGSHLTVIVH